MRTSARPSSSRRTWTLAALLFVALAATGARADSRTDEARKHVEWANLHYKLGRFDEALTEYSKAYELFPAPPLLFNLGQCHRELKNCTRALFFFESYLHEEPDARDRRLVEALITDCRLATQRQERADRSLEQQQAAERRARAVIAASLPATPSFLAGGPAAGTSHRHGASIFRRWWFWTAVAVALTAATGATLGYYYSGTTTRALPAGSLGTLDRRAP